MKSWKKFIILPLGIWLLISLIASLWDLIPIQNNIIQISIAIFITLTMILFPYSMLRTAPKYPYSLTIVYMSIFCICILIFRFFWISSPSYSTYIYTNLFWTICAIIIHFFFTDQRFKLHKN